MVPDDAELARSGYVSRAPAEYEASIQMSEFVASARAECPVRSGVNRIANPAHGTVDEKRMYSAHMVAACEVHDVVPRPRSARRLTSIDAVLPQVADARVGGLQRAYKGAAVHGIEMPAASVRSAGIGNDDDLGAHERLGCAIPDIRQPRPGEGVEETIAPRAGRVAHGIEDG